MISSCCCAVASERSCNHNFYCLNFSSNRFINHWNIQLFTTCNCILFLLWSTGHRIILPQSSCFALSNFLKTQFAEGIYSTSRILFCKACKLYQSLFSISSATLIRRCPIFGWVKTLTKSHVQCFQNLPAIFQSRSPITQSARLLPC